HLRLSSAHVHWRGSPVSYKVRQQMTAVVAPSACASRAVTPSVMRGIYPDIIVCVLGGTLVLLSRAPATRLAYSPAGTPRTMKSSKAVIESPFVHRPTWHERYRSSR